MKFIAGTQFAIMAAALISGVACAPLAEAEEAPKKFWIAPFGNLTEENTLPVSALPYGDPSTWPANPVRESISLNAKNPSHLFKRDNLCGASSFENKSSEGSPWTGDCVALANWMNANNGVWNVHYFGWRVLGWYGSCAFGGQATGLDLWGVGVGNEDIRDLIWSSIEKFAWGAKVGSRGSVTCGRNSIDWGVHHA